MIESVMASENYVLAKKLLDAAAFRHELIATNLANAETPGFKRVDLDPAFAQKLEKELNGGAVQIQYATPISKYSYAGRIFMEETQEARDEAAMLDFRVDEKMVEGKNIFLVDDSIVRGTNASRIVRAMRAAGAATVSMGALWPMVIDSCFQGINTPTQSELIGARFARDVAERYDRVGHRHRGVEGALCGVGVSDGAGPRQGERRRKRHRGDRRGARRGGGPLLRVRDRGDG